MRHEIKPRGLCDHASEEGEYHCSDCCEDPDCFMHGRRIKDARAVVLRTKTKAKPHDQTT